MYAPYLVLITMSPYVYAPYLVLITMFPYVYGGAYDVLYVVIRTHDGPKNHVSPYVYMMK